MACHDPAYPPYPLALIGAYNLLKLKVFEVQYVHIPVLILDLKLGLVLGLGLRLMLGLFYLECVLSI